jgi:hypothetical protein
MIQTGERPVTRARFRSGGSVTGSKTTMRLDRKPRSTPMSADDYLNRDVRMANEERAGIKHDGGFKYGGAPKDGRARAQKFMGGPMRQNPMIGSRMSPVASPSNTPPRMMVRASGGKVHDDAKEDKKLIKSELKKHAADCRCAKCYGGRTAKASGGSLDGTIQGMRPKGGRLARKSGGKAKGMNVNIIIAPPKAAPMMPPQAMPPKGIPAPPPQMPQGMAPGAPAPQAPMMGRKSGGRTYPIKDGAGGGLGRLEKARAYG